MEKQKYITPEIDIYVFSNSDKILTLSSGDNDGGGLSGGSDPIQTPND